MSFAACRGVGRGRTVQGAIAEVLAKFTAEVTMHLRAHGYSAWSGVPELGVALRLAWRRCRACDVCGAGARRRTRCGCVCLGGCPPYDNGGRASALVRGVVLEGPMASVSPPWKLRL
eukprot:299128-Chlamydomonas_euryale.AAC.1